MAVPNKLTFYFANDVEEAPRVARKVENFLNEQSVSESTINKILLCVDELITNIIAHAYNDKQEHAVLLECRVNDTKLELELRDDGIPFDPTIQIRPNTQLTIGERDIGGLGIHLVLTLMDEVKYHREGDYNVLVATKVLE